MMFTPRSAELSQPSWAEGWAAPEILLGLRRPDLALGGFRNTPDEQEIRIDGVQHNLSGLLGLLDLLEEER